MDQERYIIAGDSVQHDGGAYMHRIDGELAPGTRDGILLLGTVFIRR